jgi:putative endonuclease
MYYVYVLLSQKDNNFYVGFSENIDQRLDEHNAGKNVSTKLRRPFGLIYHEAHTSKSDALRRERYFKTTKGKVTLKQILKDALSNNKSKLPHSEQKASEIISPAKNRASRHLFLSQLTYPELMPRRALSFCRSACSGRP